MIITPSVYTPIHKEEYEYKRSVTEETVKKIVQNVNWCIDFAPVGTIIYIPVNAPGVDQPNEYFWQICDGGEITNPASPLRSNPLTPEVKRYTPDLRNCYVQVSVNTCEVVNITTPSVDGSQHHAIGHTHGGTGVSGSGPGLDTDPERLSGGAHTHGIPMSFSSSHHIDAPAYLYVTGYLKVV